MDKHVSKDGAKVPHMLEGYWLSEKYCNETGIPVTAIRGNFYMSHLLKTEVENIKNNGQFKMPLGYTRNSFVSTNDMGEIAAKVITEGPQVHGNKCYDITGPVPQNGDEIAQDLSIAMGKEIKYMPQSKEEFINDFGVTRWEFFE